MKKTTVRLLGAVTLSFLGVVSHAADFPRQGAPVTINLGFPPGGGMDTMTRILQEPMEEDLGATVVIDYRPGAGGNIASNHVAKAQPDGHTLLVGTAGTHGINAALYKDLPFDVENDFTPIAKFLDAPNVFIINTDAINVGNMAEFVEEIKANPSKYSYASTGFGTSGHLATADFLKRAGLDIVHVPFKGGPEAMLSLLRGEVCCFLTQVQVVMSQLDAENVLPIGVTTAQRLPTFPDVPTISETVLPDYESSLWFGLFGPKNMDPSTVQKLSKAVQFALDKPAVRQRLEELGNTVQFEGPDAFKARVSADRIKWADIVNETGANIQ